MVEIPTVKIKLKDGRTVVVNAGSESHHRKIAQGGIVVAERVPPKEVDPGPTSAIEEHEEKIAQEAAEAEARAEKEGTKEEKEAIALKKAIAMEERLAKREQRDSPGVSAQMQGMIEKAKSDERALKEGK